MNFFQDLISDKLGHASSKRLMAVVSFGLIVQAVEMNLFQHTVMDGGLLNILIVGVLGLSGASTVENMATKNPDASKKTTKAIQQETVETTTSKQP